ncbi:MAG: acyl-CoA dehydrogenase family protein [Streptosporangiaceae bacterium]
MDFWESDDLAAHRDAARAWADANVRPEWAAEQVRTGCHQTPELHARLAGDGILGAGWPPEYGGTDVDLDFARAVFDELARRGVEADGWSTTSMVAHTILQVATEEQKHAYIPAVLRGEMLIALGYSEPDSGSDVAAAKTTAVPVPSDGTGAPPGGTGAGGTGAGGDWVINGQKMFTSTAQLASHVFVLARTNPDVPKHKGLTLFLVPTASEGYACQPIYTLGGQVTNATFYAGVRVPDRARIGGVDEGWSVMKVALVYERGFGSSTSLEQTLARDLAAWARAARRPDGTAVFDDPLTAERIGRMAVDEEVTRVMSLRLGWLAQRGELPQVEGSMRKLFWTETIQRHYSDALDILGADGVLAPGAAGAPGAAAASGAPAGGEFEHDFRAAVVTTVYGGASEILREIIAERRLGLPRNRRA